MPPTLLARLDRGLLQLDPTPAAIVCRFADLPSRDGERFEVTWRATAVCVDTPADRAMLRERLLGDQPALSADRVATAIAESVRPNLARAVAAATSDEWLSREHDATLEQLILTDAKRAGFALGVQIAGPATIALDSPTVRRAQDALRAKRTLDSLRVADADRDSAARSVADAVARDDRANVARLSRSLSPSDLLRTIAAADARAASAEPRLWLAAGDRLFAAETNGELNVDHAIRVDGVGPIRSIRGAGDRLLVGGRDGVAIVERDGQLVRLAPHPANGDVGFNAPALLGDELVATHSAHGLVRWQGDRATRIDLATSSGARSLIALDETLAVLLDGEGRLLRYEVGADAATPIGASAAPITSLAALDADRVVVADSAGTVAIVHPRDPAGGPIVRIAANAPTAAIAGVDLLSLHRVLISREDGALLLGEPESNALATLLERPWPARAICVRPGFAALLGVDRQRVAIVDFTRPETPIDLHVHARLGRRVADVCFA